MLRRRIKPALSFLNLYSHLFTMGAHLSSPKTDKFSCSGGDFATHTTRYGASSMQGWRVSMEDAHLAIPDLYQYAHIDAEQPGHGSVTNDQLHDTKDDKANGEPILSSNLVGVYGVFDGHGGSCVSKWVSENFAGLLKNEIARYAQLRNNQNIELKNLDTISETHAVVAESLQSAFLKVDEELQKSETEHALQVINERTRGDNPNEPVLDGSSLFKVLLPERMSNRQQTIRLIEQHTERLLRESFNFHSPNQPVVENNDEIASFGEEEEYMEKTSNEHDNVLYHKGDNPNNDGNLPERDSIIINDMVKANYENKENADQLVTRTVHEDDSMTSGDCQPDDDYEVDTDVIMETDGPNPAFGCGSTSVVMVVLGGENPAILVANAGDSRAVLCRGGCAVALSHDHKPQLREEGERIRRAGGSVTNGRVDGNLNLSRSLGDLTFKQDHTLPPAEQRISAMPDVRICPLTPHDEFVVLACDGIWDCKSNQQVVDFVRSRLLEYEESHTDSSEPNSETGGVSSKTLARVCEELCDECLSNNPSESEGVGCDNMTVIIVQLNKDLVKNTATTAKSITLYGKQVDAYL
ncbi:putative protein phosphatase 2C 58 [Babesia sp. Xinjiang]|uniref:putative protein phosphatase 2C 58 n=1 Tax=Babesia sp. Xinjiang TaxID=462227 RepID=UPI000A232A40|nr:putative protein phosphatase 2C 58 [Babesia sp. Xinjiang]ORM42075.1 putative protein phosphatase 2C 58 [Babesia sp. Xinjiang]